MTTKTTNGTKPAAKTRRLSLSKQTLKDLGARGQGPKGGKGGRHYSQATDCQSSF